MRYAAFLRGINVGGNKKVPMADLRAVVEGLGHTGVLYVWYRDGVQNSKLAKVLDRHLGVAVTARNWNTVIKVLEKLGSG